MAGKTKGSGGEVDPQMAEAMLHEGAAFLFLDVPEGTEFGIDYNTWTVGPKFKGVKMIPPGIHFVYFSAVAESTRDVAPRSGFFHDFSRQEVLIRYWDKPNELNMFTFTDSVFRGMKNAAIDTDPEILKQNRRDFDRFLGQYPYESYRKWVSLTNHLSPGLLARLQPLSGVISAVVAFQSQGSNTAERQKMREEQGPSDNKLPDLQILPGTEIRFTQIPEKKYPDNATPAEITKYNMDYTFVLKTLLTTVYEKDRSGESDSEDSYMGILGEIQFSFVCFLIGQNYDAFEQWKHLVHLLCKCEEGVAMYPHIYSAFIVVLHHHINEIPQDFFVDIVTADNFLTRTLQTFFSILDNLDSANTRLAALRARGLKFRDNLQRKFNWDFTEDPEDEAPVIVDGIE